MDVIRKRSYRRITSNITTSILRELVGVPKISITVLKEWGYGDWWNRYGCQRARLKSKLITLNLISQLLTKNQSKPPIKLIFVKNKSVKSKNKTN